MDRSEDRKRLRSSEDWGLGPVPRCQVRSSPGPGLRSWFRGPKDRTGPDLASLLVPASRAVRGSPREVAPTSTPRPRLPTIGQCQPSKRWGAHSVPDPLPNHHASCVCLQAVQTPIGAHALIGVPRLLCSPCSPRWVFPLPILSIGSGPSCEIWCTSDRCLASVRELTECARQERKANSAFGQCINE